MTGLKEGASPSGGMVSSDETGGRVFQGCNTEYEHCPGWGMVVAFFAKAEIDPAQSTAKSGVRPRKTPFQHGADEGPPRDAPAYP